MNTNWKINKEEVDDQEKNTNTYLTFFIDKQYYAYPINQVKEIIEIQEITTVPEFPDYAKGIINLRGNVIPIIDVRIRLSKPEIPYNERTCIIILDIHNTDVGYIVDTVDEVVDIDNKDISSVPSVATSIKSRKYIDGVGKVDSKIIMILNAEKMMNSEEIELLKESLPQEEIQL